MSDLSKMSNDDLIVGMHTAKSRLRQYIRDHVPNSRRPLANQSWGFGDIIVLNHLIIEISKRLEKRTKEKYDG